MRLFPLVNAALVTVAIYLLVFERPALLALAGNEAAAVQVKEERLTGAQASGVVKVLVRHSTAQPVESGVVLRGRTEAARRVEVRAETSGLVVSDPLPKGRVVAEGEVLCRLDEGTRRAQLDEARARLAEAEVNARAARNLGEKGFASEARVVSADAALAAARAAVERAEKELERTVIKAPFSGLLDEDTAERGSLLQPGAMCARILKLDPIRLVGFAPETDTARLRLGAMAGARLATGEELVGQVTYIARSADPVTRTFRVEVEVANPDLHIPDGATAEIFIALDGVTAHLVPQSALTLNDEGTLGVRIVEDGVARFVPVTIIRDTTSGVYVAGLPEAADIIVVGQEFVTDGQPVEAHLAED